MVKKAHIILFFCLTHLAFAQQKPNVLWLDLEDLSPILAAYGDSTVSTPNIDRLSKEGITFTKAYATVGVCAPSRASIITGMFPVAIGAHNMRITAKSNYPSVLGYEVVPPADVRCFPDILRENGVFTSCSKKTDYQFSPSPFTWDEFPKNEETDRYVFDMPQPFFKQINFWETHESQIWSWCRQNVPLTVDTAKVKLPPYLPKTIGTKLDWATQYNNLKFTDAKIGKILAELEKKGILNNTIIIFTGDHGNGLPRSKRSVYESGVRVPMIVRFPDKRMAGTYSNDLVYLMDLGPTILSFYNLSTPGHMHGRDIVGKYKPKEARKYAYFSADRFDECTDIIRAVTDGRYRYIRNFQPQKPQFLNLVFRKAQDGVKDLYKFDSLGLLNETQATVMRKTKPVEELFDTQNDPHETSNIAHKAEMQAKLAEMRAALDQWLRETKDMGFIPENEIANTFWPGLKQPTTATPKIKIQKNQATATVKTEGATIGYKNRNADSWKIYKGTLELKKGDSLYLAAHRLGWKTSEVLRMKIDK